MATGSPNANSIFNRLKQLAGFKELNRKQMKLKIADMAKLNVRNMIKKAGYAGFALNEAIDLVIDASKVTGKVDYKAEKQRRANRDAKKPDELQTEPMDSSKNRYLGPATKPKPKPMTDKQKIAKLKRELAIANAVGKVQEAKQKAKDKSRADSLREDNNTRRGANMTVPKKGVSKDTPGVKRSLRPPLRPKNLKDGGMPMVMKDGKKVPAYAADGVGKMNKGGMAKKKMMAGGMAKKSTGYMYGGMAKKPKAKK